mmetsp:Transcript_35969/g.84266  ORF Transcript_35969/g.84266 Transcript_35969/m.84266 type:complete len:694 (+) Transcript_35969:28-2109(+)
MYSRMFGQWPGLLFLLAIVARWRAAWCDDHPYRYRSYGQMVKFFEDLEKKYPDLVKVWNAQDLFPEILPDKKQRWAECEGTTCKTLIVRIANQAKLTTTTPEVFFSGALHGDERLGPLVVTELAALLCEKYREGSRTFQMLLDSRVTWIMPMTNAHGFAHNNRLENGMDPNRDFAYLQQPSKCMRTQTGRAVNELFRRHLFQYMITFHGGMRALTYEWGSRNHMTKFLKSRGKSTESPDDHAFRIVGEEIQRDAGEEGSRRGMYYPLGRITDIVYYVDGGMEDWSYGAGWEEPAPKGPITVCTPDTYGGYDASRTKYRKGSLSTLVYLAEMDSMKTPSEKSLGHSDDVWHVSSSQGHAARNIRMCLRLIELTRPEVVIQSPPSFLRVDDQVAAVLPTQKLEVTAFGFGCLSVSSVRLLLIPRKLVSDCASLGAPSKAPWNLVDRSGMLEAASLLTSAPGSQKCRGLQLWEGASDNEGMLSLSADVPSALAAHQEQTFCLAIAAEFDQDWAEQKSPDPHVKPQSHAARMRLDDHYETAASDGEMTLSEFKTKLFPVVPVDVLVADSDGKVQAGKGSVPDITTTAEAASFKGVDSTDTDSKAETQTAQEASSTAASTQEVESSSRPDPEEKKLLHNNFETDDLVTVLGGGPRAKSPFSTRVVSVVLAIITLGLLSQGLVALRAWLRRRRLQSREI